MADYLPTVENCCFSCSLKSASITIGILGCFFLFSGTVMSYENSNLEEYLKIFTVIVASIFAITSLVLVIATLMENKMLIKIYVYVALVNFVILCLLLFSSTWYGLINRLEYLRIFIMLDVIMLSLFFYFIIVVNSYRKSIEVLMD